MPPLADTLSPSLSLAIVGLPNAGKSTLFNLLSGRRTALTGTLAGLTRDWRCGRGRLSDMTFTLYDTAGFEERLRGEAGVAWRRSLEALAGCALVLCVVDGRLPLGADVHRLATRLRRQGLKVLPVINKCEGGHGEEALNEAWRLGFGEAAAISALHGEGLSDLYRLLAQRLAPAGNAAVAQSPAPYESRQETPPEQTSQTTVRFAVVGRPNVGKSTLVNALTGRQRVLTGATPQLTRDSVRVPFRHGGRNWEVVDTAGVKRRSRSHGALDTLLRRESLRAVAMAQSVVLVLDGGAGVRRQELNLAAHIIEEGRSLVVALNKWDCVKKAGGADSVLREAALRLRRGLAQSGMAQVLPLSARTGEGLSALLCALRAADAAWRLKIATAPLNRWLARALMERPPPTSGRRTLKLRYITQSGERPPTFTVFANAPSGVSATYRRYLLNSLRRHFPLEGAPLRFSFRRSGEKGGSRGD